RWSPSRKAIASSSTRTASMTGTTGRPWNSKRRQHRAELVNRQRIFAVQQHISTSVAYSYNEELDLEIVRRLPLSENLQYPLLGILVLHRRSLRTFEPADHVLHRHPPLFALKSAERLILVLE